MPHPKSRLIVATLALCAASCGQPSDSSKPEASVATPPHQNEQPGTGNLPAEEQSPEIAQAALPPALQTIYQSLNMRSFPSSFGQRLKHYCESYPFEYFPRADVLIESPTRMTLVNGDDTWIIEQLANHRIKIEMTISGMGSYHTVSEYDLEKTNAAGDLRADAQWIEQKAQCKPLNVGSQTKMGLHDLRRSQSADGWHCGEYWSGGDVTPELERWRALAKLPQELDPSRHRWGAADMLIVGVKDHASMTGRCAAGEQLRDVSTFAVYDQPGGARAGKFVRISTFGHGLLNMVGFVSLDEHGSHKVNFDAMAKEQLVLVITNKDEEWIDISTADGAAAWINLSDFEPREFTLKFLPYLQRLASASELKLTDVSPRSIHSGPSDEAEVIYTLNKTRTALHPLEIDGDWMQVRFVAPPEYPAIGCGDEEGDFNWINGWLRWRDGDEWFVTEEHHYGC